MNFRVSAAEPHCERAHHKPGGFAKELGPRDVHPDNIGLGGS